MVTLGARGAVKQRIDSERNQGRAPDMGWLDHDRLGFNYRLSDLACALGIAQLGRLEQMLAERARVAGLYREALGGLEGLELPCADSAAIGAAGSCSSCSCRAASIAMRPCASFRRSASRASPTCRRST